MVLQFGTAVRDELLRAGSTTTTTTVTTVTTVTTTLTTPFTTAANAYLGLEGEHGVDGGSIETIQLHLEAHRPHR